MKQVLYSKYNRTRKPKFQIGTKIILEEGQKYVCKFALGEDAISHIDHLQQGVKKLQKVFANICFEDGERVSKYEMQFPYVEGINLSDKFQEISTVKNYFEKIFEINPEYIVDFKESEEFEEVFGDGKEFVGKEALSISNIDMIFDNLFVADESNQITCIDNEWIFEFPIPIDFIKYRVLHYFYDKNSEHLKKEYTESEFLKKFGVETNKELLEMLERNFQKYISGNNSRYTDAYIQKNVSFDELLERKKEAEFARERIPQLQNEVEERNSHIQNLDKRINIAEKELEEVKTRYEQLQVEYDFVKKDNDAKQGHINYIEDALRRCQTELETITYYKKHPIRRLYRVMRRIGGKVFHKSKTMIRKVITPDIIRKKVVIPKFDNPKVSIVIPVYNEFGYTYDCIRTLVQNIKNVSYEVIVGDDESTDKTRKIKKIIKNVIVNVNHTEHGFLMNCNRAAELARGEYIVFLNNDTLVMENWLESLVELIESRDDIGMVGSKLIYPDGRLQEAGGIIWKDATGWNYGREQNAEMPEYNYVRECDYISGASIMISKKLWKEIGGFDERFKPAYCEDSDLAFEVRKRGYKVLYQPKSVVIHFEGVSNGTDLDSGLKKYQVENNTKFKEKWASDLEKHYSNAEAPFCARERNFGKKVILVIDHYVPTFDKDAGSKTTFQYIKMFIEKGYIVKFLGDNFAQMEPYTSILQQMGVEVLYGPWYAEHIFEWIDANKEYIDFVYLNRPHISEKYIDFLREKTNIKLIYYGHDLHFLRTKREAELTGNDELFKESKAWKNKEFMLMKKAAISYYPSVIEENAIHDIDPEIRVKAITAYVFDKFIENYRYIPNEREGLLFVGGFSHGPNIDAVKWFVNEVYPLIKEKQEIPFYIVGSNAPAEIKKLDGNGIIFKGFVSDEELAELYKRCKMVVVPLRYGAGVKGKVVEAIYNGAPIVTTDVGAEGISGIENIVCIENEAEAFAAKVLEVYNDDKKLSNMGENTQAFIKKTFSIETAWNIVKDDFA